MGHTATTSLARALCFLLRVSAQQGAEWQGLGGHPHSCQPLGERTRAPRTCSTPTAAPRSLASAWTCARRPRPPPRPPPRRATLAPSCCCEEGQFGSTADMVAWGGLVSSEVTYHLGPASPSSCWVGGTGFYPLVVGCTSYRRASHQAHTSQPRSHAPIDERYQSWIERWGGQWRTSLRGHQSTRRRTTAGDGGG